MVVKYNYIAVKAKSKKREIFACLRWGKKSLKIPLKIIL